MTNEMAHPDLMLMKIDPIWDHFCISEHTLILNSYGDTHMLKVEQIPLTMAMECKCVLEC